MIASIPFGAATQKFCVVSERSCMFRLTNMQVATLSRAKNKPKAFRGFEFYLHIIIDIILFEFHWPSRDEALAS